MPRRAETHTTTPTGSRVEMKLWSSPSLVAAGIALATQDPGQQLLGWPMMARNPRFYLNFRTDRRCRRIPQSAGDDIAKVVPHSIVASLARGRPCSRSLDKLGPTVPTSGVPWRSCALARGMWPGAPLKRMAVTTDDTSRHINEHPAGTRARRSADRARRLCCSLTRSRQSPPRGVASLVGEGIECAATAL